MLSFQKIHHVATPEFALAWPLYEASFPEEERRTLPQQTLLFQQSAYSFQGVLKDNQPAGILGLWHLSDFTFLEHFAIENHLRGQGLGSRILEALQQSTLLPLILEVEPPTTHTACRRIAFYERSGFALNPFPYQQPPYNPEKPWVPLQLMSFPAPLSMEEFTLVKTHLYEQVYRVGKE